jgi:hypothetical protein
MKRISCALLALLMLASLLTGCASEVPRPEIKQGRFDLSVTYEQDGAVKVASAVYVCEYDGIAWTLEGHPYVDWETHLEGDITDEGTVPICTTEDGGEIVIALLLYPEFFMGDPQYADHTPLVDLSIFYYEENGTVRDSSDDAELIAGHGVRLIGCEYDPPIPNSFKPLK